MGYDPYRYCVQKLEMTHQRSLLAIGGTPAAHRVRCRSGAVRELGVQAIALARAFKVGPGTERCGP
jgi:hypothetical protein